MKRWLRYNSIKSRFKVCFQVADSTTHLWNSLGGVWNSGNEMSHRIWNILASWKDRKKSYFLPVFLQSRVLKSRHWEDLRCDSKIDGYAGRLGFCVYDCFEILNKTWAHVTQSKSSALLPHVELIGSIHRIVSVSKWENIFPKLRCSVS